MAANEKARSVSIYIAPHVEAIFDERTGKLRSRSEVIGDVAERYAEVCKREIPDLSVNEWKLVCDALNGCWMRDTTETIPTALRIEIEDAIRLSGLDKKWQVDGKVLARKLSRLRYSEALAVWDTIERFWAAGTGGKVPGET